MPMRKSLPALLAMLLMPMALSAAETLEELTSAVKKACENHDADGLSALCYREGQPEELTAFAKPIFQFTAGKKDLQISVKSVAFDQHKSELPGEFQGKPLEFLVKPTHWILIHKATAEGENPKMEFNSTFAAAKVKDQWKLIGVRYKE